MWSPYFLTLTVLSALPVNNWGGELNSPGVERLNKGLSTVWSPYFLTLTVLSALPVATSASVIAPAVVVAVAAAPPPRPPR